MISTFSEFLSAAIEQEEPQRLLFLFAEIFSEPSSNTGEQHESVSPVMCVDKLPEDIESFDALKREADTISKDWNLMITIGLAGKGGMPPSEEEAEPFLDKMANDLTSGSAMSEYIIFDRDERQVEFEAC